MKLFFTVLVSVAAVFLCTFLIAAFFIMLEHDPELGLQVLISGFFGGTVVYLGCQIAKRN
jgi:hypothetical protein